MKIAIIDLGTNTFKLSIHKTTSPHPAVWQERMHVQLHEGGAAASYIIPAAWERAVTAMQKFREIIDKHRVQQIYAVGTSALRNASNSAELIFAIQQQTNIQVAIISGEEEAGLIYRGVQEAVTVQAQEIVLMMDIGGGSTEFVIGDHRHALWTKSFDVGVQYLLDYFTEDATLCPTQSAKMMTYFKAQLEPLLTAVQIHQPTRLVGSSGAFRTVGAMLQAQQNITISPKALCYNIPVDLFESLYKTIRYTTRDERLLMHGLEKQPVDTIALSTSLMYFVLQQTGLQTITASAYGLKEGLFFSAFDQIREQVDRLGLAYAVVV